MSSIPHFVIYSRSYCHLCDDMLAALEQFKQKYRFTVEVVDVDADAVLLKRYDELVPVLAGQHAEQALCQLCHYFLDPLQVERFLQERP